MTEYAKNYWRDGIYYTSLPERKPEPRGLWRRLRGLLGRVLQPRRLARGAPASVTLAPTSKLATRA
jgi:hypothetical protein